MSAADDEHDDDRPGDHDHGADDAADRADDAADGADDTADRAETGLPDTIDTDRDADALSAVGLDRQTLLAKLAGRKAS